MCVRMSILLSVYCERNKASVNSVVERGQEIMRQKKGRATGSVLVRTILEDNFSGVHFPIIGRLSKVGKFARDVGELKL